MSTRTPEQKASQAAATRAWRVANPERVKELTRKWQAANPEYHRIWCATNQDKVTAKHAKRRAAKMRGTPPWIDAYKVDIVAIYAEAQTLGWHVDHIVPLQGKTVSGLHVPWNLRPLHPRENKSKGNKFDTQKSA